jgi:hypothetical protein
MAKKEQYNGPVIVMEENKSSIELHRNAKGEYSWKIKYYEDYFGPDELEHIRYLDKELRIKYAKKDN